MHAPLAVFLVPSSPSLLWLDGRQYAYFRPTGVSDLAVKRARRFTGAITPFKIRPVVVVIIILYIYITYKKRGKNVQFPSGLTVILLAGLLNLNTDFRGVGRRHKPGRRIVIIQGMCVYGIHCI